MHYYLDIYLSKLKNQARKEYWDIFIPYLLTAFKLENLWQLADS